MIKGYDAFLMFQALKAHFLSTSYDYFKYGGRIKIPPSKYDEAPEAWMYRRVARGHNEETLKLFFISNIVVGRSFIGELLEEDAKNTYNKYVKQHENFGYHFSADLDRLLKGVATPTSVWSCKGGQYPEVVNAVLTNKISMQSFAVFCYVFGLYEILDEKLGKGDVFWPKIKLVSSKLMSFIQVDLDEVQSIIQKRFP